MVGERWITLPFDQAVQINPKVTLDRGRNYPFVDMKSVDSSFRSVEASERREFKGSGSRFMHGDTLMARITPCLENGKIARYVSPDGETLGHGSTEFIVIRGKPGVTDNDFVYYLTVWEGVRGYAISQMTGSSGRQRVPVSAFSHLEINLPPLHEQQAIACILGALDDKIELNRRMNGTLEAMARAFFKSWFVDFDPVHAKARGQEPPGLAPYIAALFPESFEPSEIGEIPKGWRVTSLSEIATFMNGLALQKYPPKGREYLPVIKIAQLRKGNVEGADRASIDINSDYIIKDGDVLFSWSGSLECVIWAGGRGALNQHLFKVTSEKFEKWFYYLWIHNHLPWFRHIAATKATTMGHIQRHHLDEAKVLVPSGPVLEVANKFIGPLIDGIIARSLENRRLATLRDTLLPKLISGKLRVPDAERIVGRCM